MRNWEEKNSSNKKEGRNYVFNCCINVGIWCLFIKEATFVCIMYAFTFMTLQCSDGGVRLPLQLQQSDLS